MVSDPKKPLSATQPTFIEGVKKFVFSPKCHAAWVATISGAATIYSLPGTMKEKSPYIADYLYGVFGVWAAVIISWGYENGKALEGTVPAGRESTNPGPTTNVNMGGPSTATVTTEQGANVNQNPPASVGAGADLDKLTNEMLAALAAGKSIRRKE